MARIEQKIESGKTHVVAEAEAPPAAEGGAEVVDLMALLKRSLEGRAAKPAARKASEATDEAVDEAKPARARRTVAGKSVASGASAKKTASSGSRSKAAGARSSSEKSRDKEPAEKPSESRRRRA